MISDSAKEQQIQVANEGGKGGRQGKRRVMWWSTVPSIITSQHSPLKTEALNHPSGDFFFFNLLGDKKPD